MKQQTQSDNIPPSGVRGLGLDILVFASHPDDAELSCGGTLIKHISAGKKCGIIDLTRGELGTRGTVTSRDAEAAEASRILGLSVRENLNFADGFFQNDKQHQTEVVKMIRKYQPEIILCNAISDRHPDHSRASQLVSVAAFLAGLIKVETSVDEKKQTAWKTKAIYHYIQDRYIKPDFVVDITDEMELKMQSVMAYKTQFFNPDSTEPSTAISTKEFVEFLHARAMEMGRQINVKYAEGFTAERFIGVKNLFDLL
jgi:bacillithiol biosynthesis deacetylase BshB1